MESRYDKMIVAFVDFLGFKSLIGKKDSFCDAYVTQALMEKFSDSASAVTSFFLSDSLFMAALIKDSMELITTLVSYLYIVFCSAPIGYDSRHKERVSALFLLRGGIAIGDAFVSKEHNTIFGPAVVRATDLEKVADMPRVIIEKQDYFDIPDVDKDFFVSDQKECENQEFYYLDFLKAYPKLFNEPIDDNSVNKHISYSEEFLDQKKMEMENFKHIYDKYSWWVKYVKKYDNERSI